MSLTPPLKPLRTDLSFVTLSSPATCQIQRVFFSPYLLDLSAALDSSGHFFPERLLPLAFMA